MKKTKTNIVLFYLTLVFFAGILIFIAYKDFWLVAIAFVAVGLCLLYGHINRPTKRCENCNNAYIDDGVVYCKIGTYRYSDSPCDFWEEIR